MNGAERHRRNVRTYQRKARAEGRCTLCPKPAVTADYCEQHRRSANEAKRQRYTRKDGATVQVRHCPTCGQGCHNRRTCFLEKYLRQHSRTAQANAAR